ncbi:hypothetical protein TSUD_391130 [Trifolium subterraneum]|uniref:Uncharacterized protein n=1 Tax=Trifolium subterraneum TaxID=3900 RepID=A0A2Z6LX94_TRISU|nr:hypothetical protein TSUD_391130 [Trifolium subterraneum]
MLVQSLGGEDSSSNTDESMGTDGDAGEDKGEVAKRETSEKQRIPSERRYEVNEVDHNDGVEGEDHGREDAEEEEEEEEDGEGEDEEEIEMDSEKRQMHETLKHGGTLAEKSEVGDTAVLHDEYKRAQQGQAAVFQQHKKHKEPQDRHKKAKLLESLCSENPMLSSLCGTLFPKNSQSVWSGPHSLVHQRNSARTSSIHAAIGSFME